MIVPAPLPLALQLNHVLRIMGLFGYETSNNCLFIENIIKLYNVVHRKISLSFVKRR